MRRDRIIEAVECLRQALSAAQVREVLSFLRNERSADATHCVQRILACYSVFSQHHMDFEPEERELMDLFGLSPLADVNFWSSLIDSDSATIKKQIGSIDVGLYNVMFVMPKLKDLLARPTDKDGLLVTSHDGSQRAIKRLRMNISENGSGLTQTVVMSNVFKAVEEFYEALFPLHKISYVPLSVGGIDSGKVKVIDFFGVDDVITDITDVLAAVWHRVKYSMVDNFRYEIQVSVSCVEFYSRLEEAKRAKLLSQDDVNRIVQTMSKSIEVIFRNGAYTEDMNQVDDMRASAVLQRRTQVVEQQAAPAEDSDTVEFFQKGGMVKQGPTVVSSNTKQRAH